MNTYIRLLLVNLACFVTVLSLSTPLLNSGDDAYCVYLLSGGFGGAPSELTLYNHVLHPIITIGIRELFTMLPTINWYGYTLIAFHFLATSVISVELYKTKPFNTALVLYLVFFIVFEIPFLLGINFTNTSIVLTFASLAVLFRLYRHGRPWGLYFFIPIALLVFASFFRIHVMIPLMATVFPFLLFGNKQRKPFLAALGIAAGMIILFHKLHEAYYSGKLTDWRQNEHYRQMLYKFYNDSQLLSAETAQWETEVELLKNALILDTTYLSAQKLTSIYAELQQSKILTLPDRSSVRWTFINNRIFLLTAALLFLLVARRWKRPVLISLALGAAGVVFLMICYKLPTYMLPAGIAAVFVVACTQADFIKNGLTKLLPVVFLLFWGLVRAVKENNVNVGHHQFFINSVKEVAQSDHVFLIQDNAFPIDFIGVFDSPACYKLTNIIWGSFDFNSRILAQYNSIQKLSDIIFLPNLLVWGKPVPAFLDYLEEQTGVKFEFSEPLKQFTYGEVRRIVITNSDPATLRQPRKPNG